MTGRVYIVQQPVPNNRGWVPDIKPAMKYGEIKYVFGGGESVSAQASKSLRKAKAKLSSFNPLTDFLLDPGCVDSLAGSICVIALKELGFKGITFLQWNKSRNDNPQDDDYNKKGVYVPVLVDESEAGEDMAEPGNC